MSRSYLRNRYMKVVMGSSDRRNPHHFDEMPKNRASKYITAHCKKSLSWLQEASSFCGHKVHTNGHRMVSGMVRQKVREEIRKIIDAEMAEGTSNQIQ